MAGETIVEALQGRQPERLRIYQEKMRELVRPFKKSWRQCRWLYAIPDRVWNTIGELMDGRRFDALPFRNLPGFLRRNPWMLPWLLRFHDLQSHYRKITTFAW